MVAITWVLKNWKLVALALVVLALLGAGKAIYDKGRAQAELEQRLENSERLTKFYADQWAKTQDALTKHTERTEADAEIQAELASKVAALKRYAQDRPGGGAECLDGGDTDKLRDLWKSPSGDTKPSTGSR
jgi:hypothetical protein